MVLKDTHTHEMRQTEAHRMTFRITVPHVHGPPRLYSPEIWDANWCRARSAGFDCHLTWMLTYLEGWRLLWTLFL